MTFDVLQGRKPIPPMRNKNGGQGGIRTPVTLAGQPDFESGAFNRALPPVRNQRLSIMTQIQDS
jgi:hypothetical protein